MGKIVLVGENRWTNFADATLRDAGEETITYPEAHPGAMRSTDLVILSPGTDHLPSKTIGKLLTRRGPLRILVVDVRVDYTRAGDAARAGAVGYETRSWNRDELVQVIETYKNKALPAQDDIERRFASC